jgi:signal transduction histidine kinase
MSWLRGGALALIAVLCVATLVEQAQTTGGFRPVVVCAAFAAYAVAFVRNTAPFPRRLPWQAWALLAQLALSLPFDTNLTVVTAATIPLVIERRRWRVWLLGTLCAVATAGVTRMAVGLSANWKNLPAGTTWIAILVPVSAGLLEVAAWHLFAFLASFLIVHFDQDRRRLSQLNAELKGSQVLLMESGRLAERLRISRELHDSLGHHLTSLSLQLEVAEHLPDQQLRPQLAQARFIAKLLLADIREAVSEWRAETSTALPDALQALAGAITGAHVTLDVETQIPATSPTITHALFRCTQEALTNAIKHGGAGNIAVSLRQCDMSLHLGIQDDGRGTAELHPGHGLEGIQSRVSEIGGTATFSTAPGQGFRIEIQVPLVGVALQ